MSAFEWQGGTNRGSRPYFGAAARTYDEVRPGYGATLVAAVLEYAGHPAQAVEIGAGTGKATSAFVQAGLEVVCLEPDTAMSRRLESKFAAGGVRVESTTFEDWTPAAKTSLLYCAQAWHWLDPVSRCRRAADALTPGGTLALFGHRYLLANPSVEEAIESVYLEVAPGIIGASALRRVPAQRYWYADELRRADDFEDIEAIDFPQVVSYDVDSYLRLVRSFSSHRGLPPATQTALIEGIGLILDERVEVELATVLVTARRMSR